MKRLGRFGPCLLALLLLLPVRAGAADPFDSAVAADVFATALAFMAPRILEPVAISQLTLWGLGGLPALDPSLSVSVQQNRLVLRAGNRDIASRPLPPEGDSDAWANAAAQLALMAWNNSPALRRGGGEALIGSFFDELFNHFDPYSRYVPPVAADSDEARRNGTAGIGVELEARAGGVAVSRVKPDSPAGEAGIKPGDRILTVDGQPTAGQDAATIASWLAGPEETGVALSLRQDGRVRQVALTRVLITPETVFPQMMGSLLVLRVTGFARDTDTRIEAELLAARHPAAHRPPIPPMTGIVLDLRGNRGGLLRQAVLAADSVLAGGVVAVTAGRDPDASTIWRAGPDDVAEGLPIVVLVDGRTASAAEILAAALQDQGRAVVVGSATLGKGLVQTIAPLPDGGELFVTWSRVLTPSGYPLQGLGVLPQLCTSQGQEVMERQITSLLNGKLAMRGAVMAHEAARPPVPPAEVLDLRAACPAAEGRELDLRAARLLLENPSAYAASLLGAATP